MKRPRLAPELMQVLLDHEFREIHLRRDHCLAILNHMRDLRNVTFYESCYHIVALETKGVSVTADSDDVKKAKGRGHIALLAEWRKPRRR